MEQITILAEKLKGEFPDEIKELYESMDFLTSAFDTIYDSLAEKVNILVKEQQLTQAGDYLQDSQSILDCRALVLECAALLEDEKILDEEIASIEEDEEKERRSIPDYEVYRVDNSVEHNLFEDFTYTKACGFNFCGQYVEVANMKWVLVETCTLLAQLDPNKMKSLLTDKSMKGRKVSYFDIKGVVENNCVKSEKIPGTNIYVWTASSCNMTRNLIRKVLKKFNIPLNQFKIYLRADYSGLHHKTQTDSAYIEAIEISEESIDENRTAVKIGRYVQGCFDDLEKRKFSFTSEELELMQSNQWSLKTFGLGRGLFLKYDATKSAKEQTRLGEYNRYWKQLYTFGGSQYFINSQWFAYQREKFDIWYKSLDIKNRTI